MSYDEVYRVYLFIYPEVSSFEEGFVVNFQQGQIEARCDAFEFALEQILDKLGICKFQGHLLPSLERRINCSQRLKKVVGSYKMQYSYTSLYSTTFNWSPLHPPNI